jgi:hypothetical protein
VRHRREHPDPEHVELEQAERRHVVLVELAHRVPVGRAFQRRERHQVVVPQQDPAGVHRQVAGEAVDALDQVEQQPELAGVEVAALELGQPVQRRPHVPGAGVVEALRDDVELLGWHPQHLADLADRHPGLEGLDHRDAGGALLAEPCHHEVVDVLAAVGLDVEVDVGQLVAVGVHEPFEREVVRDRVHVADAEREADQAPRGRPPTRHQDTELADVGHDVGDGEEQVVQAEPVDHRELVLQPLPHRRRDPRVAVGDPRPAATVELAGGGLGRQAGQPWDVQPPDPEVDLARGGELVRGDEQVGPFTEPSVLVGGGGEPRLGGGAAEVVAAERDLLADAPDHVGDHRVLGGEVAHVVDRDRTDPHRRCELERPADPDVVARLVPVHLAGPSPDGASSPWCDPVVAHPEHHLLPSEHLQPRAQLGRRGIHLAARQQPTHRRVRAQDRHHPVGRRRGPEIGGGEVRVTPDGRVRGGHRATEVAVPRTGPGQEAHPRCVVLQPGGTAAGS